LGKGTEPKGFGAVCKAFNGAVDAVKKALLTVAEFANAIPQNPSGFMPYSLLITNPNLKMLLFIKNREYY
jgi:hypothetical protein